MSLEDLRKNIEQEKRILGDMSFIKFQLYNSDLGDRALFNSSLQSFKEQLRILNKAIPYLLKSEVPEIKQKKLLKRKLGKPVIKLSYVSPSTKEKRFITINKEDKAKFIRQLSLSVGGLKRLKKLDEKNKKVIVSKPSEIARMSNLVFSKISEKLDGKFIGLKQDLKKANSRFNIRTYISISLFVSSLIFILSLLALGILILVNLSFIVWGGVPFFLLFISLTGFYVYPSFEKRTVERAISEELPFATIHMAAIAGADIEPSNIFRIVAASSEYPHFGKEVRKMINQIDIYGSDLVNALKITARQTSNEKLAELFFGLATNIV